uniref:CCHC-type domain-containing protein n=1 Tax=Denticeps clupeoides TaxID=299321 RepID=A0AAY4CTX1_9TELE
MESGVKARKKFRWRGANPQGFPERVPFIREVLFGVLSLKASDIVCVQRNGPQRFVDVTVLADGRFTTMLEVCREKKEEGLKNYAVEQLWWADKKIITVHIFNPFLPAETVRKFLQQYVELQPGHREMRDELGIWNGRRQFQARLRPDPSAPDGLCHPPGYFNIEGNRGYLFYPQQPPFCKLCLGRGHTADACTNMKCRNCLDKGHMAKDCTGPRRCKICGGDNHLARSCPQYKPLYSDALVDSPHLEEGRSQSQGAQAIPATKSAGSAVVPETPATRPTKRKGEIKKDTAVKQSRKEAETPEGALSPARASSNKDREVDIPLAKIIIDAPAHGPGYWKFNISLLEEKEYRELFLDQFKLWT